MSAEKLTVAELIEALMKFPPDKFILMEGCDCHEYAGGVSEYMGDVYLDRI